MDTLSVPFSIDLLDVARIGKVISIFKKGNKQNYISMRIMSTIRKILETDNYGQLLDFFTRLDLIRNEMGSLIVVLLKQCQLLF